MALKIIKSASQINNIFQKGTKIPSHSFVLFYLRSTEETAGFAAIAPKKTFKHAVDRNFVKRRLRELCRKHISTHLQIAVLARASFKEAVFAELEQEFIAKIDRLEV